MTFTIDDGQALPLPLQLLHQPQLPTQTSCLGCCLPDQGCHQHHDRVSTVNLTMAEGMRYIQYVSMLMVNRCLGIVETMIPVILCHKQCQIQLKYIEYTLHFVSIQNGL
jgi:hypothetical protein